MREKKNGKRESKEEWKKKNKQAIGIVFTIEIITEREIEKKLKWNERRKGNREGKVQAEKVKWSDSV